MKFLKNRIMFHLIKIDTQSDSKNYSLINLLLSNAATNHRVHVRECVLCTVISNYRGVLGTANVHWYTRAPTIELNSRTNSSNNFAK